MKQKLSIVALVAIVAVTAGLVGYSSSTSEVSPATTFVTSPLISGHLTLEARDADGNLKAYRTSDNVIVKNGEDCVAKALFGSTGIEGTASAGTGCVGPVTEPFTWIALGTGTTQEQGADNDMEAQTAVSGLTIAEGAITSWTNSTGAAGGAGEAKLTIEKAFTNGGATTVISEAGLFNASATNTNGMFAHKVFEGISLANGDQLTVSWTINMGNTTNFD